MITVENRPAMRLDCLSTEELISYAETYAVTALEKELLAKLLFVLNEVQDPRDKLNERT